MQLSELLQDWPCFVKGSIRVEVARMQDVVQQVQAGDCYIARAGKKHDGKQWIEQAIRKGAVAIVVDDELFFEQMNWPVPIVWVPNCQTFDAYANAKLCGHPAEALTMIAITGTNGKTTVSHFVGQLLTALRQQVLVIGTVGVYEANNRIAVDVEPLTTLKPQHLQPLLQQAVRNGISYVVLEASSMGLAQHRLNHCAIDIGVFLNLTADHIEDHGTLTKYKLAKQHLMQLSEQVVVNQDDAFCKAVGILAKKPKYTFSMKVDSDCNMQKLVSGAWQTTCCLHTESEQLVVTLPLAGEYQLQNVAAAVSVCLVLGYSLAQLEEPLKQLRLPLGRMQRYELQGIQIVIDYAHTADALKEVLTAVKAQTSGEIIVVFSCGGERDQAKRKEMGTIASQLADEIVLTVDNSRTEQPEHINRQIKEGFFAMQSYVEILSRAEAIDYAIKNAKKGDTVVIAGKGHETTQIVGNVTSTFSDIDYVENLLATFDDEESAGCSR